MKKILAMVLAMMLVLSMSAAFADDAATTTPTYSSADDVASVTLKKTYNLAGVSGKNPEETFTFEISGATVTGNSEAVIPQKNGAEWKPEVGTVTFAEGSATSTGNITINLPTYTTVGVYTYTITEVANNIAGVTYRTENIVMKVQVVEGTDGKVRLVALHAENAGGDKTDTFTDNTYTAGKLTVDKVVTGIMGDKTEVFNVTVSFSSDKEVKSDVTYISNASGATATSLTWTKVGEGEDAKWTASVDLEYIHGTEYTFSNIPSGVTYSVVEAEANANGYTTTYANATGTITDSEIDATITNDKDGQIDTGIALDNAPYMILMALVVVAGAALIVKRASANR